MEVSDGSRGTEDLSNMRGTENGTSSTDGLEIIRRLLSRVRFFLGKYLKKNAS